MDQTSVAVGESVGRALDAADLSLRKAAAQTGIPYTTLHRKIKGHGKTGFTINELLNIAEALDMSLSQLLPEEIRQ
ncbi:helix-turn-helix domain-containing protein [Nocardia sp. CA-290969]|uniref:helix-turn-helix domain-containing protein n=1 Tax=Nocardia sp. CA-290969 TaxID=3239986 RepID=UPI003D92C5AA